MSIDTVVATNATCLGISDGSLAITAMGGTGIYEYSSDNGNTFVNTSTISLLPAGLFDVVVRDENDCRSGSQPVTLFYNDTVRIGSVTATDLTCSGSNDGSISITATGGTGPYEYSTDGGTIFGASSTINSLALGDYQVVARDENQCLSAEYPVTLNKAETCGLVIYDAISPGTVDGKNDVWYIDNSGSFPNIKVTIFNIWGTEVFSSKGYGTPWDGTYKGKALPAGTYYYVIDPGDGSDVLSGPVSIVK